MVNIQQSQGRLLFWFGERLFECPPKSRGRTLRLVAFPPDGRARIQGVTYFAKSIAPMIDASI